jgi:protein gp37
MYWIEKLYIACRKSDKLVFITPYGTDKAFDGRKATGDKWAGRTVMS